MVTGQATARNPGAAPRSTALKTHPHEKAVAGEDRYRMIAEAAYYRAENRGFMPGSELDDWLAAEIEVDELLAESHPR